MPTLLRKPSAFVPILISLTALAMVFAYVARNGVTRNADEGAPARIFQLLMLVQIPMVLYFAINWLPREPRRSLVVLGLQGAAWVAPVAAILFFER